MTDPGPTAETAGKRPYETLSTLGRLRRLRAIAETALDRYDVDVVACDLAAKDTNLIYRVRAADGRVFALRITHPEWRTESDLASEAMWLDALARDTEIPAPKVVRADDGASVVRVTAPGVPGYRLGLLMTWLPGRIMSCCLTESNIEAMGELFARLHLQAGSWDPPPGFSERRFDRVLSRGEPELLFGGEHAGGLDPRARRSIRGAWDRAHEEYAELDESDGLRVIHCDLWHANIKVHRGVLHPFDFEDTVRGFRLHDLAMALLDLAEDEGTERYHRLLPVLRRGYERHLDWPEGDLIALQQGRMLWRLNWIARYEPEWFAAEAAFCADLFERTRRVGKLTDPLRPS